MIACAMEALIGVVLVSSMLAESVMELARRKGTPPVSTRLAISSAMFDVICLNSFACVVRVLSSVCAS